MGIKKIIISVLSLYFLVILQSSFFVHFNFFGFFPNFVIILVIFWNLLEKEKNFFSLGFFSAITGGLFLDIFSSRMIGFYIFILVGIAIFIKIIIRKYVRIQVSERI